MPWAGGGGGLSWLESGFIQQKAVGSILNQGKYLGWRFNPRSRHKWEATNVSLSCSLKSINVSSGEDEKTTTEYLGKSTWIFSHHRSWTYPSPSLRIPGSYHFHHPKIELNTKSYTSRCDARRDMYSRGSRTQSKWKTSCQLISSY